MLALRRQSFREQRSLKTLCCHPTANSALALLWLEVTGLLALLRQSYWVLRWRKNLHYPAANGGELALFRQSFWGLRSLRTLCSPTAKEALLLQRLAAGGGTVQALATLSTTLLNSTALGQRMRWPC